MAPRKKIYQSEPVRRSERIRLRKEAAIAARKAKLKQIEEELRAERASRIEAGFAELKQLEQQLRTECAGVRRALRRLVNEVSAGGGVTRRDRPPRRNRAVTSTPLSEQADHFDRFLEGILHAANESLTGMFSEWTRLNLNQEKQPNEAPRGLVSGQELRPEVDLVVEELDMNNSMVDNDSDDLP